MNVMVVLEKEEEKEKEQKGALSSSTAYDKGNGLLSSNEKEEKKYWVQRWRRCKTQLIASGLQPNSFLHRANYIDNDL